MNPLYTCLRPASLDALRVAKTSAYDDLAALSPEGVSDVDLREYLVRVIALWRCKLYPDVRQRRAMVTFILRQFVPQAHSYRELQGCMHLTCAILGAVRSPDCAFRRDFTVSPAPFFELLRLHFDAPAASPTQPPPAFGLWLAATARLLPGSWEDPTAVCAEVTARASNLSFRRPGHSEAFALLLAMLPVRHVTPEQLATVVAVARHRLHNAAEAAEYASMMARLAGAEVSAAVHAPKPQASAYPYREDIYLLVPYVGREKAAQGKVLRAIAALARLEWQQAGTMQVLEYAVTRAEGEGDGGDYFAGVCEAVLSYAVLRSPSDRAVLDADKEDEFEEDEAEEDEGVSPAVEGNRAFAHAFVEKALPHCRCLLLTSPKNGKAAAKAAHVLLQMEAGTLPELLAVAKQAHAVSTQKVGNFPLLLRNLAASILVNGTPEDEAWLRTEALALLEPSNQAATLTNALQCVGCVVSHRVLTGERAAWGRDVFAKLAGLAEHRGKEVQTSMHVGDQLLRAMLPEDVDACCDLMSTIIDTRIFDAEYATIPAQCCASRRPVWGQKQARALLTRLKGEDTSAKAPIVWTCTFLSKLMLEAGSRLAVADRELTRDCIATAHKLMTADDASEEWLLKAAGTLFTHSVAGLFAAFVGRASSTPTDRPVRAVEEVDIEWAAHAEEQATAAELIVEAYNTYLASFVGKSAYAKADLRVFPYLVGSFSRLSVLGSGAGQGGFVSVVYPDGLFDAAKLDVPWEGVQAAALRLADTPASDECTALSLTRACHLILGGRYNVRQVEPVLFRWVLPRGKVLQATAGDQVTKLLRTVQKHLLTPYRMSTLEEQLFVKLTLLSTTGLTNARREALRLSAGLQGIRRDTHAGAGRALLARHAESPDDTQVLIGVLDGLTTTVQHDVWREGGAAVDELVRFVLKVGHGVASDDVKPAVSRVLRVFHGATEPAPDAASQGFVQHGTFAHVCGSEYSQRAAEVLKTMCKRVAHRTCTGTIPNAVVEHLLGCFVGDSAAMRRASTAALDAAFHSSKAALQEEGREMLLRVCTRAWVRAALATNREDHHNKIEETRKARAAFNSQCARVWRGLFRVLGDSLLDRVKDTYVQVSEANGTTYFELVAGLAATFKHDGQTDDAVEFVRSAVQQAQEIGDEQTGLEAAAALHFAAPAMRESPSFLDGLVHTFAARCRNLSSRVRLLAVAGDYIAGLDRSRPAHLRSLVVCVERVTDVRSLLSYDALREHYACFLAGALMKAGGTAVEAEVAALVLALVEDDTDTSAELLAGVLASLDDRACCALLMPRGVWATVRLAAERRAYSDGTASRITPLIAAGVTSVAATPDHLVDLLRSVGALPRDVLQLTKGKHLVAGVMRLAGTLEVLQRRNAEVETLSAELLWRALACHTQHAAAKEVWPHARQLMWTMSDAARARIVEGGVARSKSEDAAERRVAAQALGCAAMSSFYTPTEETYTALKALLVMVADPNAEVGRAANGGLVAWRMMQTEKPSLWVMLSEQLERRGMLEGLKAASDFTGAFS